ncbi:MAG: 3-oxoacyl-ACP synthase [Bacteroidetes bacterium]|nr:MAG: 3-oxoacyl-ACP synthase [Bacteroidota bacterium]
MANDLEIKRKLFQFCNHFIDTRLQTIQKQIEELQFSLLTETKSSAGDKHETGRAMLQLEREKAGNQLAEIQKQKQILKRINPDTKSQNIALGSIVYTTKSNYFIGISAGELVVENDKFYAISPATPIAQLLLSKAKGDSVNFRDTNIYISKIL